MNRLFTIGYSGSTSDDLARFVEHLDAVLVDIRYSPASRNPDFSRKRLSERLGARYVHLKSFGNVNYRSGGPIEFMNEEDAILRVACLLDEHAIILMCACSHLHECHRKPASE